MVPDVSLILSHFVSLPPQTCGTRQEMSLVKSQLHSTAPSTAQCTLVTSHFTLFTEHYIHITAQPHNTLCSSLHTALHYITNCKEATFGQICATCPSFGAIFHRQIKSHPISLTVIGAESRFLSGGPNTPSGSLACSWACNWAHISPWNWAQISAWNRAHICPFNWAMITLPVIVPI